MAWHPGFVAMACLSLFLAAAAATAKTRRQSIDIHVSAATGSDTTGDGTSARPYASLAAGQFALRATLAAQELQAAPEDVEVRVAAGDYYDTALRLTEADSPRPGSGVAWVGAPNANVYGGARVTGWSPATLARRRARQSPVHDTHAGRAVRLAGTNAQLRERVPPLRRR